MNEKPESTRSHEIEIAIDASPEQVWEALTSPTGLTNWFPLEARVEPGEGGLIHLAWGAEIAGDCGIEIWEPSRHLRMTWGEGFHEDALISAVDFNIEAQGGSTVLKLVHSGFGSGAAWDKEYDGTHRGWNHELRSLRCYLQRHRGKRRRMLWARAPIGMPVAAAWERLMSPEGLLAEGSLEGLKNGDSFAICTAAGDELRGTVELNLPPTDFLGIAENMGDALFRVRVRTRCREPRYSRRSSACYC